MQRDSLPSRRDLRLLIREQAAWNRQNLAQGRLRAFISAWLDTRAVFRA